jgi:hypothetical protein
MVEKTKIRVIRVAGGGIIATPEGKKLTNAMTTDYEKPDLKTYIKKANVDELETVELGDREASISRALRPEELLQWEVYTVKMTEIKKMAIGKLENDLFDKSF